MKYLLILILIYHYVDTNIASSLDFWLDPLLIYNRYQLLCNQHNCKVGQGRCLLDRCVCLPGWDGKSCEEKWIHSVPECVNITNISLNINNTNSYFLAADDSCYYHPDYGVLQVSMDRWKSAQHQELSVWMKFTNATNDRSIEHSRYFNDYESLPLQLGHVLELACGPFTQLKHIMSTRSYEIDSITLVDPMILEYKYLLSNCAYKNQSSFISENIPLVLINARAEDINLGEKYDTVVMINGIEHAQDGLLILKNVYDSIKPGGYLVFAESIYDNYTAKPFSEYPHINDFILHPLRIKEQFILWFISHFDIIHNQKIISNINYDSLSIINLHGIDLGTKLIHHFKDKFDYSLYIIARKPLYDKGWEMLKSINNILQD